MKHVLSYGGGVNSSALFFFIVEKQLPLDLVIFADTGEELPATYEAVERMKQECDKQQIPFATCRSHHGKLYDYYKAKRAVPSMMKRDCTGKFKVAPIRKYVRELYGKEEKFLMYIGITIEEWHRMRDSNVSYITHSYPFCDAKITRQGNIEILKAADFAAAKSGCIGCIYNKKQTWLKMAMQQPDEFARWEALDKGNMRYPQVTLSPAFKLEDIRKQAKGQLQLTEYEEPEPTCNSINGGCFL